MKKCVLTIMVFVCSVFVCSAFAISAQAQIRTIHECQGTHPETKQVLLLTLIDSSLEKGSRIDVTTIDGKDLGAYSVTRVYPYSFSMTRYDLGLDGGFGYGAIRIREDYFTKELFLEFQAGHLVRSTLLKCQ